MDSKLPSSRSLEFPAVSKNSNKDKRDDHKKKKMKGAMVNDDYKNSMLDLKLSSFNSQLEESKTQLAEDKPNNDQSSDKDKPPTRVFTCNYCKGEFSTSQALGGHQNAHKQERARDKMRQATGFPPYSNNNNLYHPYNFGMYSNIPYGGYCKRSPLGVVKTNSMIHKPNYNRWPIIHGYNYYGYNNVHHSNKPSLLVNNNSQPSFNNLKMPNNVIMNYSPLNRLTNNLSSSLPSIGDKGDEAQIIDRNADPKVNPVANNDDESEKGDIHHIDGGKLGQLKLENSCLDLSLKL